MSQGRIVQGWIVQGRIVWGRIVQGQIVPVPWKRVCVSTEHVRVNSAVSSVWSEPR
jgi:hypothetical protein